MSSTFNVFIVSSNKDLQESTPLNVTANEWVEWSKNIYVFYASDKQKTISNFKRLLSTINPDFVYLQSMYSIYFTILPLILKRVTDNKAKWILSPRGMLQAGALKFKSFKKHFFLKVAKNILLNDVYFHVTDEQEKKDVLNILGISSNRIEVIPNFSTSVNTSINFNTKMVGELKLIFTSRIAPKKNLFFILNILKKIQKNIDFTIAGNIEDEVYWQKCKNLINLLPINIKINYVGAVANEEIKKLLVLHHLAILSSFGENFGHSIFESFAVGRPVLISDQTPWQHLQEQKAGWSLPLPDAQKWEQALNEAISWDQTEFNHYANHSWLLAREFMEKIDLKQLYLKLFSSQTT